MRAPENSTVVLPALEDVYTACFFEYSAKCFPFHQAQFFSSKSMVSQLKVRILLIWLCFIWFSNWF